MFRPRPMQVPQIPLRADPTRWVRLVEFGHGPDPTRHLDRTCDRVWSGPSSGIWILMLRIVRAHEPGPILSVFPALIVHTELKSVHPGFPVAFIFMHKLINI